MQPTNHFYDENAVRYQLVKTNPGEFVPNWLFVPGGPGADSSYFLTLIEFLTIPGNFWLIDLPANGSNISEKAPMNYDFDQWENCFISAVQKFENPIYVGHSFGAMFPLLFTELENILTGFIILNSSPCLWSEESAKCAQENNITALTEPLADYEKDPNPQTFKKALMACAPYYFPKNNLEAGKKLLESIPFNYLAPGWWFKKAAETNFTAKWIPQNVPTLILGASDDFITPFSLFERDIRFKRENIKLQKIENAGHFPWLEQPMLVKDSFRAFFEAL
jgi:pimeloyl-ACP methyl ester carboxylesterase